MIQIECTDEGFEGIREDIWILMSMCDGFATRELYDAREVECLRDLGEVASADERRAYIGELSLGLLGELMKECLRHRELEDSISEVFEAFIRLFIAIMGFIQDASVDAGESVETGIFRENLEGRQERSYLRFKLFSLISEGSAWHILEKRNNFRLHICERCWTRLVYFPDSELCE